MKSFYRPLRIYLKRLVRSTASSHEVACGIALGIFVSVVTPYFTHLVIALGLAYLFRGNKLAAAVGTFFNNPLTAAPIYYIAFKVGVLVWHAHVPPWARAFGQEGGLQEFWQHVFEYGHNLLLPVITGLWMVGAVCAILGYIVARFGIDLFRGRKFFKPKTYRTSPTPRKPPEVPLERKMHHA